VCGSVGLARVAGMRLDGPDECAKYARRANASRRGQLHCIEGEYVTMLQIIKRAGDGVSQKAMYSRLRRARERYAVVLWEHLV